MRHEKDRPLPGREEQGDPMSGCLLQDIGVKETADKRESFELDALSIQGKDSLLPFQFFKRN